MATAAITVGVLVVAGRDGAGGPRVIADAAGPTAAAAAPLGVATPTTVAGALPDLDVVADNVVEVAPTLTPDCVIESSSLRLGDSGIDVSCLQQALIRDGYLDGAPTGTFDQATYNAVDAVQSDKDLFVDGVAGRETAMALKVWPDEMANVVRTTPLPAGTKDELGFPVSSVTALGDDIPPLPENSGSGKRVVYSRDQQRVWAVAADGHVVRSWLVSGSKYNNEMPGTHQVYSRSEVSTAWNGRAYLPRMIRYQKTQIGAIGFHGIPTHVADGTAYQTEDELGTRLSGGCQRQANPDSEFLWYFAPVGTTVVVL